MAVLIVEDLVSRKWLTEVVSVEETSTQVELAFTDALHAEGLLDAVQARHDDGRVDVTVDEEGRPILLAVSDNGPQMTSGSTREFLALCAIAQHFGRPHTPTDQAWIQSLNGHLKAEYPHLARHPRPGHPARRARLRPSPLQRGQAPPGRGYVTPNDEHEGRGPSIRKAREAGLETARLNRLACHRRHRHTRPEQDPDDVG
jgi:putative transposase